MFQVQVDESEDTEWNDILRAKGVIPERPPSPTEQLEEMMEEAIAKQMENRLDGLDISDLEELEDDEDEDFLEFYKQKRFAEIKKLQEISKFGDVVHINKPEYQKEVTDASNEPVYVFVHLSLESKLQSRILGHIFQTMCKKYREIKFVEILGNRAIENYPDNNCPTLLVYHKGNVLKNMITLLELGGNNTTLKDFEEFMVKIGAVDENDERLIKNQEDDEDKLDRKMNLVHKKTIRSRSSYLDNDDDDFFS